MSVLAFETNQAQAAAIRQACALAGTAVTVVESATDLLRTLDDQRPSLVLLPPLVPAADEAALVEILRTMPKHEHVEVLLTPVLGPSGREPASRGWLRRTSRRLDGAAVGADAAVFAERLRWSIARARQRRLAKGDQVEHEASMAPTPPVEREALAGREALVDRDASVRTIVEDVIAHGDDLNGGLQLSDPTMRLLQKLQDDRRSHRRFAVHELQGLRDARIKFGPRVALIDLSAGGALLETDSRLQPDSEAMLELAGGEGKIVVPFRVLRSQVAALGSSPRYRGACAFKSLLNVADLLESAGMMPAAAVMFPPPRPQACNAW